MSSRSSLVVSQPSPPVPSVREHTAPEPASFLTPPTDAFTPDHGAFSRRRWLYTSLASLATASFWGTRAFAGSAQVVVGQQASQTPSASTQTAPQPSARAQQYFAQLKSDIPNYVRVGHSISYRLATRVDADSRRLDVYRDESRGKAPVVIFFHGGAWRSGHRRQYVPLGVSLVMGRTACVIPSFSQAPQYPFPEPLKDAAACITWVRDNISNMGGNPDKIFLAGHSSGAQIAALVALDPRYLQFHHLDPTVLRGVITISGIYQIPRGFEYAFGADPDLWRQASPHQYIRSGAPPFLVVSGSEDASMVRQQEPEFLSKLREAKVDVESEVYPGEDHNSIIAFASLRDSALQEKIREFVLFRS